MKILLKEKFWFSFFLFRLTSVWTTRQMTTVLYSGMIIIRKRSLIMKIKKYGKNISHFETTPANYQAYNVIKISTDFLCVLYGLFKVPFKGNNPYTNRRETSQTSAPAKLIIIQLTVYFSDSFNIVTVQL